MQIKDLTREMVLTEIITERDGIILNQHQQIEAMQKELEAMRAEIEKLKATKEA